MTDHYRLPEDAGVWEYDDYPHDAARLVETLDAFRAEWPNFRAAVFAIPLLMTDEAWRPLLDRADWVRIYPHGFHHKKRECRSAGHWSGKLWLLDDLAADPRWTPLFKSPWYGYGPEFLAELFCRGFSVAQLALHRWPFPGEPGRVWNIGDHRRQAYPGFRTLVAHPVYADAASRARTKRSELSDRNRARWFRDFRATGIESWVWPHEYTRPAALKLHLGCGPHVFDGWCNLDPRASLDPRIVKWAFPDELPFDDNRADVALSSHMWNYIAEENYVRFALDVWRVLRPGGVWRLAEDRTDSGYVWRRPGESSRGTGVVRSLPTREKVVAALERVGFRVYPAEPGETRAPHRDILAGDSREPRYRAGQKFYAEAVKEIDIRDLGRAKWEDPRANKHNRYSLPGESADVRPD